MIPINDEVDLKESIVCQGCKVNKKIRLDVLVMISLGMKIRFFCTCEHEQILTLEDFLVWKKTK